MAYGHAAVPAGCRAITVPLLLIDSRMPSVMPTGEPALPTTLSAAQLGRLHECADCGQRQYVPHPAPGDLAACLRCDKVLRRGQRDPLPRTLALGITGVVLLLIACTAPMMDVSTTGMDRTATLLTGPEGLELHGLWELALLVVLTTIAVPLAHLAGLTWVVGALHLPRPPRHLPRLFGVLQYLRPWSMVEVYLVGLFVAYTKLRQLAHIETGPALWALITLMLVVVAVDALLDPEAVWETMERRRILRRLPGCAPTDGIACHVCGAVTDAPEGTSCPRCHTRLHARKRASLQRTWALALAAVVLYVPANVLPVLTYVQLGNGYPSTILGGARELLEGGQWPLALIVFLASVAVPVLKLLGLFIMLITAQLGLTARLQDRTTLYRIIALIGRWSMIDIFMESILVALVQFGGLVRIEPGYGALAFAAVVVLTMLAAESFDPRLMWDRAAETAARRAQSRPAALNGAMSPR